MSQLDIGALRAVSACLNRLDLKYAFTGGAIVNLLLDKPDMSPARPTTDVDVIIEAISGSKYSDVEEVLRRAGFNHDMAEGAPMCRWRLDRVIVDIMPTSGRELGLNTLWFSEALSSSIEVVYAGTVLKIVSPIGLLATKYLTFSERGEGDFYGSHDLEDFITVIDGRDNIVAEIDRGDAALRNYLIRGMGKLLDDADFREALPGHLPPDSAGQRRLPLLREKLRLISKLELLSL